jgi:hypothetical protein
MIFMLTLDFFFASFETETSPNGNNNSIKL